MEECKTATDIRKLHH